MIEVQLNVPKNIQINPKLIQTAIEKTLVKVNKPEVDITIRITDDSEILRLNQDFRGIPKTTDVLSFNQDTIDPQTQKLYLGDIIISYETALQQSFQHGNRFEEECALLAIHGTLHLVGYDHYKEVEKQEMWNLQQEIMTEIFTNEQDMTP